MDAAQYSSTIRRAGRMVYLVYSGPGAVVVRYECRGARIDYGEGRCISFGGLRAEAAVTKEVLRAIEGNAIEAALAVAEQMQRQQLRRSIELEVGQAASPKWRSFTVLHFGNFDAALRWEWPRHSTMDQYIQGDWQ